MAYMLTEQTKSRTADWANRDQSSSRVKDTVLIRRLRVQ